MKEEHHSVAFHKGLTGDRIHNLLVFWMTLRSTKPPSQGLPSFSFSHLFVLGGKKIVALFGLSIRCSLLWPGGIPSDLASHHPPPGVLWCVVDCAAPTLDGISAAGPSCQCQVKWDFWENCLFPYYAGQGMLTWLLMSTVAKFTSIILLLFSNFTPKESQALRPLSMLST